MKEARELAESHWAWLEQILLLEMEMKHRLFVDAMEHGYKHGWDDAKEDIKLDIPSGI